MAAARDEVRLSCRHSRTSPSQEAADKTHQVWHHARPQQARVIAGKASLVFAQAYVNQCSDRHVNAPDFLAPSEDEVVVLGCPYVCARGTIATGCDADPFPNKICPDREDFGYEENTSPRGQIAPVPSHPIDKKENMPALLLHHGFEGVDEGYRKKSRSLGQRKQAEGEEGVDALAKAGEQERPLGMSRTQILGFRREGNAI